MADNQNEQERAVKKGGTPLQPFEWRRVYSDWRVGVVLLVFAVAIITYLLTGNLTWHPRGHWRWDVEKKDAQGAELPPVTKDP